MLSNQMIGIMSNIHVDSGYRWWSYCMSPTNYSCSSYTVSALRALSLSSFHAEIIQISEDQMSLIAERGRHATLVTITDRPTVETIHEALIAAAETGTSMSPWRWQQLIRRNPFGRDRIQISETSTTSESIFIDTTRLLWEIWCGLVGLWFRQMPAS